MLGEFAVEVQEKTGRRVLISRHETEQEARAEAERLANDGYEKAVRTASREYLVLVSRQDGYPALTVIGSYPIHVQACCFLCIEYDMTDDRIDFRGYRLYSEPPWNLSSGPQKELAIVYQTFARTYCEAYEAMLKTVRAAAEMQPESWLGRAWKWVDPSREAHMARYDMMVWLRERGVARQDWNAQFVESETEESGGYGAESDD